MRKVMLPLGIVLGGIVLFVGSSLVILKFQGRLEGENLRLVNDNPVLGAFTPKAPARSGSGQGASGQGSSGQQDGGGTGDAASSAPMEGSAQPGTEGYSRKELMHMVDDVREAKTRNEKEWAAIEMERVNLVHLGEDLSERKDELSKIMSELAAAKAELEALREEFRRELLSIEESEDKMIRKLAEMFENMKELEDAAEKFDNMDIDLAVKVIYKMDSAKAAKMIPYMDAERVRIIVDKLSRFQERKK